MMCVLNKSVGWSNDEVTCLERDRGTPAFAKRKREREPDRGKERQREMLGTAAGRCIWKITHHTQGCIKMESNEGRLFSTPCYSIPARAAPDTFLGN